MSSDSSPSELSLTKRATLFIVGFLEVLLFGGSTFGWAQLVYLLKSEGIYYHFCLNETPFNSTTYVVNSSELWNVSLSKEDLFKGCDLQTNRFALIYMISIFCFNMPSVIMGYFLDRYGSLVPRIVAGMLNVTGYTFIGFASRESPWWLFPGIIASSLGNTQLRLAASALADLFPQHKATSLGAISGAYTFSSTLFLGVQFFVDAGIKRSHVFWMIAGLSFMSIPFALVLPKQFLKVAFYSKILSMSVCFYPLIIWLPGIITDGISKKIVPKGPRCEQMLLELQSAFCSTLLLSVIGQLLISILFVNRHWAIYCGVVFLALLRPCINGTAFYFIRLRFPPEHFNRLAGCCTTAIAFGPFAMYGLFYWMKSDPFAAWITVFFLLLASFIHPVHFFFKNYMMKSLAWKE